MVSVAPICSRCLNPPFKEHNLGYPNFKREKTNDCDWSVVCPATTIIELNLDVISLIAAGDDFKRVLLALGSFLLNPETHLSIDIPQRHEIFWLDFEVILWEKFKC
jgi:hypothetical protein